MLAIIPIRSGSKSIKDKNIKNLNGYPLAYYVLRACIKSEIFNDIILASDSEYYYTILRKYFKTDRLKFIKRPKIISKDNSQTERTLDYVIDKVDYQSDLCLIQATSPLLKKNDLIEALELYKNKNYDSLFSGYKFNKFYWKLNKSKKKLISHSYDYLNRPMRQKFIGGVIENGAFYMFKTKKYLKLKNRLFGNIGCYIMPFERSIDIDTREDFENASKVLKKFKGY